MRVSREFCTWLNKENVLSLAGYFKKNSLLQTDVGNFEYLKNVGQGGNAHVLQFSHGQHIFAVKFIAHGDERKLSRFRDEFFAASQIPMHKNIVRCYHFDTKRIDEEEMSLIIMKLYDNSLAGLGDISADNSEDREEKGWALFMNICDGLRHLHTHHIIHRDIKPQNIFYDAAERSFVIGDLGIAHFKDEIFAKEAHTKPGERLANYLFSAPEQVDSRNTITEAADIYSFGQVMQWYFTGKTIRGLGRPSFATKSRTDRVSVIDAFVGKAIQDDPRNRFQTIAEIAAFVKGALTKRRDIWKELHAFDDTIRRIFPEIRRVLAVTDRRQIREFLTAFQMACDPGEFWFMMDNEGDGHFKSLVELDEERWLFNGTTEMNNVTLHVYRDDSVYRNFFVLTFGPDSPFAFSDRQGTQFYRAVDSTWATDAATLVDGAFYVDERQVRNGYYRDGGETIKVDRNRFQDRIRHLTSAAVMIVPNGTPPAFMQDRRPSGDFIKSVSLYREIKDEALKTYHRATREHYGSDITDHL
jgi:serine/threonine protein kinase